MARFRHGRIVFAGDAAHQVSPFGARGSNSGMQDADNLGWKLKLVLDGAAPEALLDSYSDERVQAAQENIDSDRQTIEFIAPANPASAQLRDAALALAADYGFARRLVNAGRLSTPCVYGSALNTADGDRFAGTMVPGAAAADAPVTVDGQPGWLLRHLGERFCGLYFCDRTLAPQLAAELMQLAGETIGVTPLLVVARGARAPVVAGLRVLTDVHGVLAQRYDGAPGSFYLLRPDQHVAARWRAFDPARVRAAVMRATAQS
jgi:3-(3-hydroxy-phenyl)propionate hydroxylase